ncbi:hypothetical protein [Rhodococcus spongiicola]|uniref:Uncharacterized protein n=1 Tax=Rhodococcus spongiicola TaxID=2487352 RepID=A0A3S3CUZ6_9NOCA|nr:hypothetical protein [Rhodococcus spongiicola]RVW06247.1 hypothetical protein EF834_01975 [Rhodococcus spongiicola]
MTNDCGRTIAGALQEIDELRAIAERVQALADQWDKVAKYMLSSSGRELVEAARKDLIEALGAKGGEQP